MSQMPSSRPFAYVLEAERSLPKDQQTVYYLRPRKTRDTADALERASKARKVTRDGQEYFESDLWFSGEMDNFVDMIHRIENYHFSEDNTELATKGPMIIEADDTEMKRNVFRDMIDEYRLELTQAASGRSRLSEKDKKKLSF